METTHDVHINAKFPDDEPDLTMTDEGKYREILDYLKELSSRKPSIGYYDQIPSQRTDTFDNI